VSVWVESPKGNIKEGDSIELQCRGNGNMPSSILSITHKSVSKYNPLCTPGASLLLPGRPCAHHFGLLQVNLPLSNNVLLLDNVTRLHGGVYECTSTDTDTFEELSGNTSVSVHCKESARIRHIWPARIRPASCFDVCVCVCVCVDLDPAVVMPEDAVVAQGEEITATCNALSSLKTRTSWMKVTDAAQH